MNVLALLAMLCVAPFLATLGMGQNHATPSIAGVWKGTLETGAGSLLLVLHVDAGSSGALEVKLDSPEQGAFGLAGSDATLEGGKLNFKIPSVNGSHEGTLSADGKTIQGTWNQGFALPLEFTRTTEAGVAAVANAAPKMTFLPAQPPVALEDLKPVLDREFAPLLAHGLLAKATGGGIVIGVFEHGNGGFSRMATRSRIRFSKSAR